MHLAVNCIILEIFSLEITFYLGKHKMKLHILKVKRCQQCNIFSNQLQREHFLPVALIPSLQKHPLRNVFILLHQKTVNWIWVRDLRCTGSKCQVPVVHNVSPCLGTMKYSHFCDFMLCNPHSLIFPRLSGDDTNYAFGRKAGSDSYDDFVNSEAFDCKLFSSRNPSS